MFKKTLTFFRSKTGIAILVVVATLVVWFVIARSQKTSYQFIAVKRGVITEVVSVTGNATTTQSANLAFENGGTIAAVYAAEGDHVTAGETLVRLDTQNLEAQLAEAQANIDSETATLQKLQAGPTPQSIAVSETALQTATQTLQNLYTSAPNTIEDAYTSANDAVRNQLGTFFANAETNNPQLTFLVNDSQVMNNITFARAVASSNLNAWQTEIQNVTSSPSSGMLDTELQNTASHLSTVKDLLADAANALITPNSLPISAATTYKNEATTGSNEVNSAITSVSTLEQNIASAKASVAQAQAALNLTLAGSTTQDIAAQEAQVEQAKASAQAIQVNINKASLVSPMNGTVSTQNAKTGEIASPGVPVVSLIADNSLEVDAYVPEVDIGKIATSDPVSMTFDAFPNETFAGTVFYIDPSQTILSGVVDYEVKVTFTKKDPRMKSGLTANLDITTQTKNDALILPQYAILQNDSGTFVETLQNGQPKQNPVILGIEDQNGNVEIVSGATEGEQVINVGLK